MMSELPEGWRDALPDDMKNNGILDTVKSMDSLVKMAIDGRTLATTALRIPSEDATTDVKKEFREDLMKKMPDLMFKPDMENQDSINEAMKVLGRPDEPSGYELPEIPEAIKPNIDALTQTAHGAGLTNKQFNAITDGILSDFKNNTDQAYGAIEEEKGVLKKDWGAAYDQNVKTVGHFAEQTGFSEEFVNAIGKGRIDSTNMKALLNVVQGYEGEAVDIGRQATNPEVIMTPQEADNQLNDLMGNRDHAYWHPEDPNHQSAKDKVIELGKLAETGQKSEVDLFRESLVGG